MNVSKLARAEFNYEPWVDKIYDSALSKRVKIAEEILNEFSDESDEAERLASSLVDPKEFEKISFLPFIYYIDPVRTLELRMCHDKFPKPMVAFKHRKLPLIIGVAESIAHDQNIVPISYVEVFPPDIRQILSYAKTLSKMSKTAKTKLFKITIAGIKSYRSAASENKKEWLSDYLTSNRDFSFDGFALNHPYLNVDPKFGDTAPLWVHPWGTPSLYFKHKRLPAVMIVGPSIRLDENVVGEKNMVGFTG